MHEREARMTRRGARLTRRTLLTGVSATTTLVVAGRLLPARPTVAQGGSTEAGVAYTAIDGLDRSKLRFVEIDGIRTRYYEDGAGEPLVLVHGGQFGPGYSLDCWSLNLPVLARDFHVYALDRLGQGHTDNPGADADYTFEALFRHFRRFQETLGLSGAHLVGHSRGGLTIARLALEQPQLVKKLVLVDTNTLAAEDPSFPSGAFYAEMARRTPPGPPTLATVRVEPEGQAYSTAHITEDFLSRLLEIAQLPKTAAAAQRMLAVGDPIWTPSLNGARDDTLRLIDERGLPVPTLMIWAMNDVSAPLRVHGIPLYERIAAKTPDADLHVVNHSGHYVFREQYAAFNHLVRNFCLG
jgi:pimeloyl-ACP methyl ester carboxylesterase